jgi:hypothetical protein
MLRVIRLGAGECSESADSLQEKGCTLLLSRRLFDLLRVKKKECLNYLSVGFPSYSSGRAIASCFVFRTTLS